MKKLLSKEQINVVIDEVAIAIIEYLSIGFALCYGAIYALDFAGVPERVTQAIIPHLSNRYAIIAFAYIVAKYSIDLLLHFIRTKRAKNALRDCNEQST